MFKWQGLSFHQVLIVALLFVVSCTHRKKSHLPSKAKTDGIESTLASKYALKLNVKISEVKNNKLYSFIDNWYAVPYQYGGKSKAGIDCSSFVIKLYKEVYASDICCTSQTLFSNVKVIDPSDLQEGDLVFFKINSEKISHVGLYLMNNKFVHASSSKGVIISDLQENYYKKYFYKSGRIKEPFSG
jgi:murein DD-endopeptidase / murein LD-carboxypeptidase